MAAERCAHCGRKRPTYGIGRFGGGTYRRGGRTYWSSICGECATDLLEYVTPGQSSTSRYSVVSLRHIAEKHAQIQEEEAR